jgi:hypothetical protein
MDDPNGCRSGKARIPRGQKNKRRGSPYAQELELVGKGVRLWGQDFFWTMAKPIAEFEPNHAGITLAIDAWNRYLEVGTLSQGQIKGGSATNATELLEAFTAK